jgi:ubiquinone/menaquinone biosynthesis C-methylase UbiE
LIDIGCGIKPYRELLRPYVNEHVGVDHEESVHDQSQIDYFGTAYKIPVSANSFDTALCTSVLEHLEEPEAALRECFRVLKAGGVAIYAAPFIWHLHEEPRDFYRFSKYGLTYLFEKAGFEILELFPVMGFWGTSSQLLVYKLYQYNRSIVSLTGLIPALGWLLQSFGYAFRHPKENELWPSDYAIAARKPKAVANSI